jgi:hypothetical protein
MAPRLELQAILVALLGSENVYFQPPPSIQMNYPCIVYKRDDEDTEFADGKPYKTMRRYQLTYIDRDPDSGVLAALSALPMCLYDRHFAADNLNHDVYKLFF